MAKVVRIGDSFNWEGRNITRLPDDPSPAFESVRIRLHVDEVPGMYRAEDFGTEPNWFWQRGLEVES
jgi:hypothetical protein